MSLPPAKVWLERLCGTALAVGVHGRADPQPRGLCPSPTATDAASVSGMTRRRGLSPVPDRCGARGGGYPHLFFEESETLHTR